jgi:glycosyltransferase involved in cell wall biosynthesis
MATCNGAPHLQQQLESIAAQTHDRWTLWISDDGSRDGTRDILDRFRRAHPERTIRILDGPCRGSAVNFLSLIGHPDRPAGLVALADQDDVWLDGRLARAVAQLRVTGEGPAIYASRTILTDARLEPRGVSRLHPAGPAFANALVQNILAGNTIVMNTAAADLAARTAAAASGPREVRHHDWWLYLLMSGAGAQVICDPEPGLYYRQHRGNMMGAHRGLRRGLSRLRSLLSGEYADWIDRNLAALGRVEHELTGENRALRREFEAWRAAAGTGARPELGQLGIHRQSRLGDLMLAKLARLGRL